MIARRPSAWPAHARQHLGAEASHRGHGQVSGRGQLDRHFENGQTRRLLRLCPSRLLAELGRIHTHGSVLRHTVMEL